MVISRRGALQLFGGAASLLASRTPAFAGSQDPVKYLDDDTSTKKWFEAAAFVAKGASHDADGHIKLRDDILNEFVDWVLQPEQAAFRDADFTHGHKSTVDTFTLAQDAYLGGQGRYESHMDVIRAIDAGKPHALPKGYASAEQLNIALLASVDFAKTFQVEIVYFARPVVRARMQDRAINAIKGFLQGLVSPKP